AHIRINPKKFTDAYSSHPKGDADIFIPGTRARNRCLNGDLAYIKIEPLVKWRVYDSFLTKKVEEWASEHHDRTNSNCPYVSLGDFIHHDPEGFSELFKDYRRVISKNLDSFRDPPIPEDFLNNLSWWQIFQRVGKVVGMAKQLNPRIGMGYLRPQFVTMSKSKESSQGSEELQTPDTETKATSTHWNSALFIPIDPRMPRVFIPKSNCPPDFVRQPETFKFVRFVAVISHWPEDSVFAKGNLIRQFDEASHSFIAYETERILVNAGFAYGLNQCMRFPDHVESHVTKQLIPSITPEVLRKEISYRRDFRSECVFTIDPRTARDLDDALHIKCLSQEDIRREADLGFTDVAYEVGVHIADVSYYVRPGDPVDCEAENRATSIYLIQLCVPMLPRQLCEDLCSLHPGSDKLTFSVVFRLTSDGHIVSKWIGRAVINSRAKLSYEDAQAFIDEPERDWKASDLKDLKSDTDVNEICRCVNMLNELAVKIRSRRFHGGALQLNQVKPTFTLSEETGEPIGLAPFIVRPANRLVEEWMLAANEAVAVLLSKNLPRTALLRRHPPPTVKQLKEARTILDFCGIDVDVSSARSIQDSLNKLAGSPEGIIWQHSDDLASLCASMMGCSVDPNLTPSKCTSSSQKAELEQSRNLSKESHLLATLNVLTKCMNLAEYFCLGQPNGIDDNGNSRYSSFLGHYALNISHYTHFTSPIRRYADLIVHRQLAQILATKASMMNLDEVASSYRATSKSKFLHKPDNLARIADVCNARKLNSRKASEDSVELFFTVFVKDCGPLVEACSVINILDRAFDVLILSTGLVRRVYLNKLDLVGWEYEKLEGSGKKGITGVGVLHLQWKVHPLESSEKNGEKEESSFDVPTDPAILESVVAPPCNCFQQEIHLFDLVRCSVSIEGLNKLEDGTPVVAVSNNDADTLNSSKLDESSSTLETSLSKPQQSGGEISDQTLNLRPLTGRICYTSPTSAFVINPSDGNKIFIYSKALNRALPNDIVAVKLKNPGSWRVRAFLEASDDSRSSSRLTNTSPIIPAEAEEELIDESSEEIGSESLSTLSFPSFQLSLERGGSSVNSFKTIPFPSVREVLQTTPSLLPRLFPGMSSLYALEEQKPMTPLPSPHLLRTGRVVGVLSEDSASRRLVGRLVFESAMVMPSAFAEAESVDEFARPQQGVVEGSDGLPISVPAVNCFFVPEKPNFPRIKVLPSSVPNDVCPSTDLWENPHKAEGVRYICKIEDWPAFSSCPKGSLCGHIGNLHEIEPATQEILLSHGIHEDDFTEEMLKDLPVSEEDFKIPNYEYLRRKDFRSHCVVSIDPSTAKDMDDALHVRMCTKDTIEVGVHIADVSYFVRPFSALDREAANRTTSTYLVQRVIPMLPAILSERLCSLNPGVDRLAFSVIFKVDRNANVSPILLKLITSPLVN
ncbi:unnamed protein product, partial [Rodentolepis nana]|uniref:RNB domain-containing protein n=1 Tax=Rodentolepis nana TaxID=102285 RepID=A0A0R3T5K2_RODNA